MMGKAKEIEPKLFYHGISLESRIPSGHVLRKIKQAIDFRFVRERVRHHYGDNGHVSVDPVVIRKLMFLLFFENIKSERALTEQLGLRLDWLWFCGYDLDDVTPDHSVLSKARRRWGSEVFSDFFAEVLAQCVKTGMVEGKIVHIDSSMIAANASREAVIPNLKLAAQQIYSELESHCEPRESSDDGKNSPKWTSPADPDARIGSKGDKKTLGYKDHRTIDDRHGIITSTHTTAANVNDSLAMRDAVEAHIENTNSMPQIIAADKGYGVIENYEYLANNGIKPCIPHKEHVKFNKLGREKFTFDPELNCYTCPVGSILKFVQYNPDGSGVYRAKRQDCIQCRLAGQCLSSTTKGRSLRRNALAEVIDWADSCLSPGRRRYLMIRRKTVAEGSFADATNNHGYKRARWRGIIKVRIQHLLIAATQNIRKLLRYTGPKWMTGAVQTMPGTAMITSVCLEF